MLALIGFAVDEDVSFGQVPAARPDAERGDGVVEGVRLVIGLEGQSAAHRLGHRPVARDDVRPGGGEGILEVGHEDRCARIERVDQHLRLGRAGDLDAPIVEVRRRRRHPPGAVPALDRVREEVGHLARVESRLPQPAVSQEPLALGIEGPMQLRDEVERLRRQDVARMCDVRVRDLDSGRGFHARDCRRLCRPSGSVIRSARSRRCAGRIGCGAARHPPCRGGIALEHGDLDGRGRKHGVDVERPVARVGRAVRDAGRHEDHRAHAHASHVVAQPRLRVAGQDGDRLVDVVRVERDAVADGDRLTNDGERFDPTVFAARVDDQAPAGIWPMVVRISDHRGHRWPLDDTHIEIVAPSERWRRRIGSPTFRSESA